MQWWEMIDNLTKKDKQVGIAILIGLVIRFLAIPFSMPIEADGVTRIFMAIEWLANPEVISYGVWGPLHTYLIAGSLLVWNDPVYAPVVLNSLLSAAVAIPLYLFVKREWNESAGLFVTCMYLVYPVAMRYGLVAMSEIPYIFFIALTMLFLSHARDEREDWQYALLAGLMITIAGSLRYEAWGLTPFLGLLLWKKWKKLFVFLLAASIFPLFWMAGNYLHFGDALYSFHWSTEWNLVISEGNENLTSLDAVFRGLFFLRALFFGLTPLAFTVCVIGMTLVLYKRGKQWVWLIPFFALFLTFTINAITGGLAAQVRYSLGLAIFMLPFAAEWFEHSNSSRYRPLISAIIILSMIPFSYLRYVIPWPYDFPNPIPKQVNAIPRIDTPTERISKFEIEQAKVYPGGLLLDFFDWGDTYYVAVMSRKDPSNVFIMPGEVHEVLDIKQLNEFLDTNATGIVLLTANSRFLQLENQSTGDQLSFIGIDKTLSVERIGEVEGITFYKYFTNP